MPVMAFSRDCSEQDSYAICCMGMGMKGLGPMDIGVEGPLKLVPCLVGPFPCKAITKIFWLITKQG